MKTNIHGNKLEITESIKSYIIEKLGKLDKYFENPEELTATISLKVRGKEQIVEITIPIKKAILRCEESNGDLYASIDFAVDKLERQIRKNKTRLNDRYKKENFMDFNFDFIEEFENDTDEEESSNIVKRKQLEVKPMSEEEAMLQMDLLGHTFFVFKAVEDGFTKVVYKRKDVNYVIIEIK